MEKWWPLLLNSLLAVPIASHGQAVTERPLAAECHRKTYRDSLVAHYIEQGAEKVSYLDPRWNQYCDSLIAICPNVAIAYQHKAVPLVKDGKWEEAFALENKAVELDPQVWLPYRAFLKVIKTKDYEGGLADFQLAVRRNPNGAVVK